ncbi:MAG: hypothetical protein Q9219_002180 [cf. Caloplaca sp. 3 TL-2023]
MVVPTSEDALPPSLAEFGRPFIADVSSTPPKLSTRRPRAWDRLPRSPYTKRRKGSKVWKRYERSSKAPAKEKGNKVQDGEMDADTFELSGPVDATHTAKRLRSEEGAADENAGMHQNPSRYVTTLCDKVAGTPRRKMATRRSLRLDQAKSLRTSTIESQDGFVAVEEPIVESEDLEGLHVEEVRATPSSPLRPAEGPTSDDVKKVLRAPLPEKLVQEDLPPIETPGVLLLEDLEYMDDDQDTTKAAEEVQMQPEDHEESNAQFLNNQTPYKGYTLQDDTLDSENDVPRVHLEEDTENTDIEDNPTDEQDNVNEVYGVMESSGNAISTPTRHRAPTVDKAIHEDDGENVEGTIIGEDLGNGQLRRSLRRLSEEGKLDLENHETAGSAVVSENTASNEPRLDQSISPPERAASPEDTTASDDYIQDNGTEFSADGTLEAEEHQAAPQTNVETDQVRSYISERPATPNSDSEQRESATDEVNYDNLQGTGLEGETEPRRTRSGTRFSDDTNMLKDFLSRAQARKHARDTAKSSAAAISPTRSPRKALASLDSNSPLPHKTREVANRAGTPPGKVRLGEMQMDNIEEMMGDASPVRRSTRKRLPAPAKTALSAPSFIPVRRADGAEPVVLQKSVAQELALVTRTNTRRNKGQAKPPAVILKSLTGQESEGEVKGGHVLRSSKCVGWDEKLVYYQDGTIGKAKAEVLVEEKRPKARRLRGLGTSNGTPAPKRTTADILSSNGTPASKRDGRIR